MKFLFSIAFIDSKRFAGQPYANQNLKASRSDPHYGKGNTSKNSSQDAAVMMLRKQLETAQKDALVIQTDQHPQLDGDRASGENVHRGRGRGGRGRGRGMGSKDIQS